MNIKRLILSLIAVFGLTAATSAQNAKIAHINSSELMEDLPQLDSIKVKLESISKEYQQMLSAIESELTDKQQFWESNPTTDQTILEIRQKEYQGLVTRYQTAQQEGQQALTTKEAELMKPLVDNLKKVVQEVAKSKGYTYVFDSSEGGGMIYGDPSHDLMEAVKERLKNQKL
ncbi:MAG: OmpH family outer membrane protein [Bacteroidia bacterium]|nr:OmpH family outer membrane protein [Bacteroidia bacterium]